MFGDTKLSAEFTKEFFNIQERFKKLKLTDNRLLERRDDLVKSLDSLTIISNIRALRWNAELDALQADIVRPIYVNLPLTLSARDFSNSTIELFLIFKQELNIVADASVMTFELAQKKIDENRKLLETPLPSTETTRESDEVQKAILEKFELVMREQFRQLKEDNYDITQLNAAKLDFKDAECGRDAKKQMVFETLWAEYFGGMSHG